MATITPRKITDPTTATRRWQEQTAIAGPKWLENFLNPKQDPKAAMLQSGPSWQAGVQAAIARNGYVVGVGKIDETEMADNATSVGQTAFVNGTQARVAKFGKKIAKVISAEGPILDKLRAMPHATIQERAARAVFWITEMAKLRGTF